MPEKSSRILHRQPNDILPVAISGDGPYIIAEDGKLGYKYSRFNNPFTRAQ